MIYDIRYTDIRICVRTYVMRAMRQSARERERERERALFYVYTYLTLGLLPPITSINQQTDGYLISFIHFEFTSRSLRKKE